jgi:mRNA interferase HigB
MGSLGPVEIVGEERISEFASQRPAIKKALYRWLNVVEEATWNHPADMKRTFGSADIVGTQTVFNIGGNKCRLVALIHDRTHRVLVQHVLTHLEYDKGDWKQ